MYILPVCGGEAEKVTDVKTSVINYDWSHNSKMVAFTMADAAGDEEEKNKNNANKYWMVWKTDWGKKGF